MEEKQKISKKSNGSGKDKTVQEKNTVGALPPKEWEFFDPTAFNQDNRLSLRDIFGKKTKPKSIDNATDLINFVESEVWFYFLCSYVCLVPSATVDVLRVIV